MHTVYIFIPERLFSGAGVAPGSKARKLVGHACCHSDRRSRALLCSIYITRALPASELVAQLNGNDTSDSSAEQTIGWLSDSKDVQPHPAALSDENQPFHVIFCRHAAAENQTTPITCLLALRAPDLDASTRIRVITYSRHIPAASLPAELAAMVGKHRHENLPRRCTRTEDPNIFLNWGCRKIRSSSLATLGCLELVKQKLPFVRQTAVFQHVLSRCSLLAQPGITTFTTLSVDAAIGLLITMLLLHIGHPYFHLTAYTGTIVRQVRQLLDALKGFPIGLKLNIELNNFLLGIFTYHIDLWVTFLQLMAPVLDRLFGPFIVIGLAGGVSTQLALLTDLLVFISLHAHCFYVYVAVLYHNGLRAIAALWRVLRGLRCNGLKSGRVEHTDYSNRQLYLATMLFAALLFLLPTVLLYYVVFAFLRFCIYCATSVLIYVQRAVLMLPVHRIAIGVRNAVARRSGRQLRLDVPLATALANPGRCTVTTTMADSGYCYGEADVQMDADDDGGATNLGECVDRHMPQMLSVWEFFMALVRGQIMGYVLPLSRV